MVAGNIKKMIPKQTFTSGLIKYPRLASTIWFVFMAHIYINRNLQTAKTLTQLKALAQTMSQLEQNTNFLLDRVLNGSEKGLISGALKNVTL